MVRHFASDFILYELTGLVDEEEKTGIPNNSEDCNC